jgi:hypothetical protein
MASITEPLFTGEQVLHFVRREDVRIAPSDMQCVAAGPKGARCAKDKCYDEESDTWSSLCEKHTEQNDKARVNEAKKVKLFQV